MFIYSSCTRGHYRDGMPLFSCLRRHQQFLTSFISGNGDNLTIIGLWGKHITARTIITKTNDEHHGPGKCLKSIVSLLTCKNELPNIYMEFNILNICYYSIKGSCVPKMLGL